MVQSRSAFLSLFSLCLVFCLGRCCCSSVVFLCLKHDDSGELLCGTVFSSSFFGSEAKPLTIITGVGAHSVNKKSVLKPALRKVLDDDGWLVSEWTAGLVVRGRRGTAWPPLVSFLPNTTMLSFCPVSIITAVLCTSMHDLSSLLFLAVDIFFFCLSMLHIDLCSEYLLSWVIFVVVCISYSWHVALSSALFVMFLLYIYTWLVAVVTRYNCYSILCTYDTLFSLWDLHNPQYTNCTPSWISLFLFRLMDNVRYFIVIHCRRLLIGSNFATKTYIRSFW